MRAKYKIKPEIEEFILAKAKLQPELGCRKLSSLVQEQFSTTVSKSTVNSILKAAGFNKSVGRPKIHKKRKSKPNQLLLLTAQTPKINSLLPIKEGIFSESFFATTAVSNEETGPKEKIQVANQEFSSVVLSRERKYDENETVDGLGYWFLKAADLCFGGMKTIASTVEINPVRDETKIPASAIPNGVNKKDDISDLIARYETLLYMPLFGMEDIKDLDKKAISMPLNYIVGKKVDSQEITAHLDYLKSSSKFDLQAVNIFSSHLTEVCGIKFIMEDGSIFLLDADSHNIWSGLHIPGDFSWPIYKIQSYLKNTILSLGKPFVIQSSPAFSEPSRVFFDFVRSCIGEDKNKILKTIELYSQDNYLLDTISGIEAKERLFIIGLWPWQYEKFRFSEYKDNFIPLEINPLIRFFGLSKEKFSYSEGRIILKSDKLKEEVCLRSISLKRGKDDSLTLITNIKENKLNACEIVLLYLERWPNLEEGYQYFLNKIKISTYAKSEPKVSEVNLGAFSESQELSLERIFGFWRVKLSEYCQNNFFPSQYKDLDIFHLKERIYGLGGQIESITGHFEIRFNVQYDYMYLNDLIYACQRVNEKNIVDHSDRIIHFSVNIK